MQASEWFAFIAVPAGIGFILTMLVCRRRVAQGRLPGFLVALATALCTAVIMVFVFHGRNLFTRRFWDEDAAGLMFILVPMLFGMCLVFSVIPGLLVVRHFRRRFRNNNRVV